MRHTKRWVAALAASALVLTACGDGGGDTDTDTDTGTTDTDTDTGDDGDGDQAAEDLGGASVSIFGAPTSVEAEAMQSVIDEHFNEPYNANATYEGSDSFEEQVQIRIDGGNPPDVALFPQPGAVIEQAQAGNAISLEDLGFDIAELEERFGSYLLSLGEYEGEHYGIPTNVNYKSMVWYNPNVFESEGYEVPESWDDMVSLSEQMVADGYTPWSIGTGSDAATGWPATDWLEDIVLRHGGPDTYDQWVEGEVAFTDDPIRESLEMFGEIVFGDGFVVGGPNQIPDIDFREAPDAIIGEDPAALMHRQASFVTSFFPDDAEFQTDYDYFPFPQIEGQDGALIAGELAAIFRDAPEVQQFIEVYTGQEAQCAAGQFEGPGGETVARISPNVETTGECYVDEEVAAAAENILTALREETARFDASDLMPPEVGSGSFWTGMNEWMRGADTEQVLEQIQASWPDNG